MARRVFDQWVPIIIARIEGAPSDQDHQDFLTEAGELLDRYRAEKQRIVLIVDLSRAGVLSARQRKAQVDWLQRYRPIMEEVQVGMAFVLPSRLLRGVLTAVFWFVPPPTHYVVASDLDEAVAWSIARAEASSLDVPEAVRHAGARIFSELL